MAPLHRSRRPWVHASLALLFGALPSVTHALADEETRSTGLGDTIEVPGFGVVCRHEVGGSVHVYPLSSPNEDRGEAVITLTSPAGATVSNGVHEVKRTVGRDRLETYLFSDWGAPDETARLVLPTPGDLFGAFFVFDFDATAHFQLPREIGNCQVN